MATDIRLLYVKRHIRLARNQRQLCERIAANIRYYRLQRGLTQRDLADLLGYTQPLVARLESPEYRDYKISTLTRVALALDVTVPALVRPAKP